MISLRYHVVSIAAVFLALALGVVLGSTTLSNTLLSGLNGQKEQLGRQVSQLQAQNHRLQAQLAADDKFTKGVAPLVVHGALQGKSVALVTTADASPSDADAVVSLVKAAGGSVTAQLQLTKAFADPARADQLRDLVTRLIPAGAQLPTASDPGTLAGGLLADVLLRDKRSDQPRASDQEITAAISGLTNAGFVQASGDVKPAQLAIVLTGGSIGGDGAGDRAVTLAHFATQLRRSSAGVVLAGRSGSASGSGPIGVVRADTGATSVLSTVDDLGTEQGHVVTVLALREQAQGHAGSYGIAGNATAPMPGGAAG